MIKVTIRVLRAAAASERWEFIDEQIPAVANDPR
jgi:hypothetical protein